MQSFATILNIMYDIRKTGRTYSKMFKQKKVVIKLYYKKTTLATVYTLGYKREKIDDEDESTLVEKKVDFKIILGYPHFGSVVGCDSWVPVDPGLLLYGHIHSDISTLKTTLLETHCHSRWSS